MSLLAKVSAAVAQTNRPKNIVVRITGYELNPNGTIADQKLLGNTLDGKQIKVVMNPPISDKAAQLRTTIVDLKTKPKKAAPAGSYVRIDKAILKGDTYYCDFIRRLTTKPNDELNQFVQVQARVNRPATSSRTAFGQQVSVTRGRIDLIDGSAVIAAQGADEFIAAVHQILIENPPAFAHMGRRGVLIRDPQEPKAAPRVIYVNATKTDNGFTDASPKEVLAQLSQNAIYTSLESALRAMPEAVLEVVPAVAVMAMDQTAGEREYTNNANIFFRGNFNLLGSNDQVVTAEASGFREAIIGLSRKEAGSPWYVVSVTHTGEGELTLNGLDASKSHRVEATQQRDVQSAPAAQPASGAPIQQQRAAAAPASASSGVAGYPQHQAEASLASEGHHSVEHDYAGYPEAHGELDEGTSLEELFDQDSDVDAEINDAIRNFQSLDM